MTTDSIKQKRASHKFSKIPVKIETTTRESRPRLPREYYIRIPASGKNSNLAKVRALLDKYQLSTVCQEASCPNLCECFMRGTATFLIMGNICTRRCAFCDVEHGKPSPLNLEEPMNIAKTVQEMGLKYVVITSVDRDDLKDGGASHFVNCILATRKLSPNTKVEILTPDFQGKLDVALKIFEKGLPDVFNHNLETTPRLYKQARYGANYDHSLKLLKEFKRKFPAISTKSGIMLGLGETDEEIIQVLKDMRAHDVQMLTLGQYLQPTKYHMPVKRYVTSAQFAEFGKIAKDLGFKHVASGPLVRSSYHADLQTKDDLIAK